LTTEKEDGMTTRRHSFAVVARILICLAVMCVVALGVARDSAAVPLESWDDQINNPTRFKVLPEFNNEAVLDRETQLVWQRDVGIAYGSTVLRTSWETSNIACLDSSIGGRKGWRLPSVEELASLTDTTLTAPALPAGHPFLNVHFTTDDDLYWTNTSYLSGTVFVACFGTTCRASEVQRTVFVVPNTFSLLRWCVRGGQGPHILR
jgi:uncharacterized protein DUF1566